MKRTRALASVVALTGSLCAIGAPALGDAVRLETKLGGFSVSVNAAPFKVLIDDPSNPLPRPEDEAIAEADPSFTLAEVATGPAAHGLASSLWPGNLLGNGLAAATENQAPNYPVKADARYPDKPYASDDQTGGNAMHATANGLEALASAADGPQQIKGTVDLGAASSTSTAVVDTKDVAIGRSTSRVSDVTLLGLIKIGSVSTVVETRSDGVKQSSTGMTTVSGLSFAGQDYVVDDKGAHPAGGSGTPVPLDALSPLTQAGITISGIGQTSSNTAEGVKRDAKGLRITVDTTLYRKALSDNTPGPVTDAAYQLFAALPLPAEAATYRSFLYYTLSATPKISFVLGAGTSATVANLPLSFEVPTFTPPAFGTPPGGGAIFPPSAPAVTGSTALPPALGGESVTSVAPPVTAGGAAPTTPDLSATAADDPSEPFTGLGGLLVFGALLAAGLGGAGLLRLRGLFLTGAPVLGGCALGAPSSVPDLRGATA